MKPILNPWRLAMIAAGSRQPYSDVSFVSRGEIMHALVPSTELWVAVKDVLVLEDYELDPASRLDSLPHGSTVLDAGAHVGLFSLKAANYARRVIAVEPNRTSFSSLQGNLRRNHVTNVEARQVAISSVRGSAGFLEGGTSSLVVGKGEEISYETPTVTLEDIIDELGHVDLMKMDIEGAEYDVLLQAPPATIARVDRIAAEIHFHKPGDLEGSERLVQTLRGSGMRVATVAMPFKDAGYGFSKPWRCSLRRINGRTTVPYRLLISAVYGMGAFTGVLRSRFDIGATCMLFASRP